MKYKIGNIFKVLGAVLIFLALSLLLYNQSEEHRAGKQIDDTLQGVKERLENSGDIDPLEELFLQGQGVEEQDTEMTVVEIDGYGYVGYLSLPTLGLELPVMAECTKSGLRITPGRYTGSCKSDDLVIAAHNYKRHFGNISKMNEGDEVIFTDMDGNVHSYEVAKVETLGLYQVQEMVESEWDLTLYTCTYGGAKRVTVRCERKIKESE